MRLKINAVLALLTTLALLMHVGYNGFAYLTMYYNPTLKTLFTTPFLLCVCLHAVLGMCSVFLLGDGTRLDLYRRPNRRTVMQRIAAALIFPLLRAWRRPVCSSITYAWPCVASSTTCIAAVSWKCSFS